MSHIPVLFHECLEALNIQPNGTYVDGTFGRGGHAQAILNRLGSDGMLWVFDKDPDAIAVAQQLAKQDARVNVIHDSFATMETYLPKGRVHGVLLDLGVSSPQLDEAARGFSFMKEGPLDMRMNPTRGESVATWLTHVDEATLADIIWRYGEERFAKRIAKAIVSAQAETPFTHTLALAEAIAKAVPFKDKHKHPATRTFQALRIFINQELSDVERVLERMPELLAPKGRLAVIGFHSLEDRLVKQTLTQWTQGLDLPRHLPVAHNVAEQGKVMQWVMKKTKASQQEQQENVRSRSATLRVVEKI